MTTNVSQDLFIKTAGIVGDRNITPARKASVGEKCQLYGLYKRGTVGKLNGPYSENDTEIEKRPQARPVAYNMEARAKYDAWLEADKYSMQEARDEYVKLALHLVGEPVMDAIEEQEASKISKSIPSQIDVPVFDAEEDETTDTTAPSEESLYVFDKEQVEMTEPSLLMGMLLYTYACLIGVVGTVVAISVYAFACVVEFVATFMAAVMEHEKTKAAVADVMVEGLNAFLKQPDLAEHLQVMSETLDTRKEDAAKQLGRDTPAVVGGFFAGVWDGLNSKNNKKNSSY